MTQNKKINLVFIFSGITLLISVLNFLVFGTILESTYGGILGIAFGIWLKKKTNKAQDKRINNNSHKIKLVIILTALFSLLAIVTTIFFGLEIAKIVGLVTGLCFGIWRYIRGKHNENK
jgi:uncharacterized oligopeptide transporter (OPT) family protein